MKKKKAKSPGENKGVSTKQYPEKGSPAAETGSSAREPFIVYGRQPVLEALSGRLPVYKIQVQEDTKGHAIQQILNEAEAKKVEIESVTRSYLENRFSGANHQGTAAFISSYNYVTAEEILHRARKADRTPFLLMLDHIQDPQNLGAVLRTASAAGVDGVIIPRDRACEVTPAVFKTSAGALAHLAVAKVTNLAREIERLKKEGLWIMGADMAADTPFFEADFSLPLILVLGSEGRGLSRLVKEKCDFLLHIPMEKAVSSLNVAAAGSIILYEVYRQRMY